MFHPRQHERGFSRGNSSCLSVFDVFKFDKCQCIFSTLEKHHLFGFHMNLIKIEHEHEFDNFANIYLIIFTTWIWYLDDMNLILVNIGPAKYHRIVRQEFVKSLKKQNSATDSSRILSSFSQQSFVVRPIDSRMYDWNARKNR